MIPSRVGWLMLDGVLACLALVAGIGLVREVVEGRPLPRVHVPSASASGRAPAADPADAPDAAPRVDPAEYRVIAARNLFAASRGEVAVAAIPAEAAAGGPSILHGVLLDGERSRAYLDDPVAKRVFGYGVGDPVAGGRVERILDDRVVIRGPQGIVEILLRDPSKPPPEPPVLAGPSVKGRAPGQAAPPAPASEAAAAPSPVPPGAQSPDLAIPPTPEKVPQ
jgi:hypothetical protein